MANSKIGNVIGLFVLAGVCVAGGWVASSMWTGVQMKKGKEKMAAMAAAASQAQTVAVCAIEKREYNLPEKYIAHAEAVAEVDLLPQVDGYIREIKFKEGDIVKEGQLLYVLDDERYQAVVNQRKADLAAAEADARRASRYFERMQKADERGITQLERDNAEADAERSRAAVLQAKANLVVAEYDLKKAKVEAPISGQIGKTIAHVGDYVAPSKGPLAHIMQVDPIRVTFPITDRAFVSLREAQVSHSSNDIRMRLILPNGSEYKGEGKFDFDDNQMSRETATIIMRLSFANPDRLLVPNTYLTLLTDSRAPKKINSVPQQAVFDLTGGSQGVYVLNDDMTVEQRIVTTLETFKGWTPILTGLDGTEKVVISGISKLRPGMKVALAEPTSNDDIDPNYKRTIED